MSIHKTYTHAQPIVFLRQLLNKALKENRKVLIVCDDPAEVSKSLWSSRSFLPHALSAEDHIEHQKIFVADAEENNPVNADIIVNFCREPGQLKSIVIMQAS